MTRVRVIFWMHVIVALYCISCALLDLTGHFEQWMIPNGFAWAVLVLSAFALPGVAFVFAEMVRPPHRRLLLLTHCAMSFGQLFFGLMEFYT